MNKEEAKNKVQNFSENKRNQSSLVDLILEQSKIARDVYQIPGGATLNESQDKNSLPGTIFNWLRARREFQRFEISFAGDYEDITDLMVEGLKPKKASVEKFDWKPGLPMFWERFGLKDTAERLTNYIVNTHNIMSISLDRDGITVISDGNQKFTPENELWNPVLIVHSKNSRIIDTRK